MNTINHIGILGQGKMGSALFFYLLGYNYSLRWLCSTKEGMEKAQQQLDKKLRLRVHCGVMSKEESKQRSENTIVTDDPEMLADCDLIIELIPEDLEKKKKLFGKLDPFVKKECILVSGSSSILPSFLVPSEKRRSTFAGLHFFFPVNMKKAVELVTQPDTSENTISTLNDFLISIGKRPFLQDERTAFAMNRILLDFQAEAYKILLEGKMGMKEMDTLVKTKFFSIGVFDFFVHVGVDVMLSSILNYSERAEDPEHYRPLIIKMEGLVSMNKLGIKTKEGFFSYEKSRGENEEEAFNHEISPEYLKKVEARLRDIFRSSISKAIQSGIRIDELEVAMTDYLGIDHSQFNALLSGG